MEGENTEIGISDAALAKAAAEPQSFSVEGVSQSNRSIGDLIALDKYLRQRGRAGKFARRSPLAGLVSHMVPPGTCDR